MMQKSLTIILKKMFNQDEGKIECVVGNRQMGFWRCKKADIVLILFLTSWFAVFICLWLLVLPNSNNLNNHVLYTLYEANRRNWALAVKIIFVLHYTIYCLPWWCRIEKMIECSLGNREFCFGRASKLRMLNVFFWRWDSRHLFVSDS